jgi:prepilin-type N-terminal cleavage/methylation domain-containing protein
MRRGFTLIEVLVSVMLISVVVLGIARIEEQNIEAAGYLSKRMLSELSNTLFLGKSVGLFSGKGKDAYTVLKREGFKITKDRDIAVLKGIERKISVRKNAPVSKDIPIAIGVESIMLKGEFSSIYYRIGF